ncbi:MAG: lipopolysaccharide biosynthesis protein [Bacteroidales bacterium]
MKNYFKYFTQQLLRSELLKSASILITGTVLAQAISILLQPFLRRYFSPEVFGTFSVYLSFVGIILIFSSFRYDDAIVLPRKDKDSANLLFLSISINFTVNLLLILVVSIWGRDLLRILNISESFSVAILYLIPISAFLYSTYQSFNYWLIRKKRYMAVSVNKMTRRGIEGISQVIFAFLRDIKGLVYGDIIGQLSNNIVVIYQSVKNEFRLKDISYNKMRYVLIKYSEFPKYNLIPALMSACSYLLPVVFINKYYSSVNAGYFDLSKLLLSIPLAFVATAVSNVLLQRISEKYQQNKSLLGDIKPLILVIAMIVFFEIIIILLFGVNLFKFVFGQNWGYSGEISKILVWSFALNFIVSSFSAVFIAMRKIKLYSIWQFFYFCAIIFLFTIKNLSFTGFLKIYVGIEVVCYIAAIIMISIIIIRYESILSQKSIHSGI